MGWLIFMTKVDSRKKSFYTESEKVRKRREGGKKKMKTRGNWKLLLLAFFVAAAGVFSFRTTGDAAEAQPQIAWIYVDPSSEGTQAVVVSMTDSIKSAVLTYRQNGRQQTQKAVEIKNGNAAFLLEGGGVSSSDLVSLKVKKGSSTWEIDLQKFKKSGNTDTVKISQNQNTSGQVSSIPSGVIAENSAQIRSSLRIAQTMAPVRARSKNGDIVIVLDPGHGGYDIGASRTWNGVTYKESEITLKMAKAIKEELETYAGVRVYMTRTTDVYVELADRVDYAARMKADVLVSVHINSTGTESTTATGAEVMVSSGNYQPSQADETKTIALKILESLGTIGFSNRGLVYRLTETGDTYPNGQLTDYYAIVRRSVLAGFPGMIVEHGFVSNDSDCLNYYSSDVKIKAVGTADAKALAAYYGLQKGSSVQKPDTPNADTKKGWFRKDNKVYYRRADGTLAKGISTIKGKKYSFSNTGIRKTGWRTSKGKTYYFDPRTFAAVKGWKTIGGKRYYFNSQGVLQKGIFQAGNYWYYANSEGYREKGWKIINGEMYYFKPTNGRMIAGRTAVIRGQSYTFGEDGAWLGY